ncbi:MAG: hypothetical protein IPO80_00875 [Propionibacteriaceae bacterium]|nr:hypothetical protein [Propionibacteriaceae bacterium]
MRVSRDQVSDSFACGSSCGSTWAAASKVPDATHHPAAFPSLLERHKLGEAVLAWLTAARPAVLIMLGGVVDAIIAAPQRRTPPRRDPEMHPTKKGNQWYFGMKAHAGVDAGGPAWSTA